MEPVRILAFAGSLRRESFNKKLIAIAASGAERAGAVVTLIDLRDFALPVYDGDLEEASGVPANGVALAEFFRSHEGLLLACPEYNSSMTAVLKNTIDWVSRVSVADTIGNKVVGLLSASPGALGGMRGLVHVRQVLGNLNALVLPGQVCISKAHEAFGEDGLLKDARQQANAEKMGAAVATAAVKWAR